LENPTKRTIGRTQPSSLELPPWGEIIVQPTSAHDRYCPQTKQGVPCLPLNKATNYLGDLFVPSLSLRFVFFDLLNGNTSLFPASELIRLNPDPVPALVPL